MGTLTRLAAGGNIIILLALCVLMNLVIVAAAYPKFQTLDTLISYTPHQAFQLIASYDERGRQAYLLIELTLELLFIVGLLAWLVHSPRQRRQLRPAHLPYCWRCVQP